MYRIFGSDTSDTEPEDSVDNKSQDKKKVKAKIPKNVRPTD